MINIVKPAYPNDSNTLLLLHGEDLTDSSPSKRTITNSGVTASAERSKFGGKSLYFNGSSYIQIANLIKGSMPFTVDLWVYPTKSGVANTIWSHNGADAPQVTGGVFDYYVSSNFIYHCTGFLIQTASSYPINQWYHLAIVGDGSSIKMYLNGQLAGTSNRAYNFSESVETFGKNDSPPNSPEYFNGYIDELRVSSVARWTANFTPPTEPYTDGILTVTPGGIIPQKYALRRRTMVTAQWSQDATVQIVGGFHNESNYYNRVIIEGVTYTASQTLVLPKGTEITLQAFSGLYYSDPSMNAQIIINGARVAAQTNGVSPATYMFAVNGDCVIEGFTITGAIGTMPALRVTT